MPRGSSLLNYLKLCDVGFKLNSDTLQDTIRKVDEDEWRLDDDPSRELTSRQVVEEVRFNISEDEPDRDLDRVLIYIEPADKLKIKREIAEEELEEPEPCAGMKLAVIDITGDEPIETATFDGGGSVPQEVSSPSAVRCHVRCAFVLTPPLL
mgnify:CR=1 FL=1